MGTIALGTCQRNTRMTIETTMISSISLLRSVSTAALDQVRPVVRRDDLHARGERRLDLLQPRLDALDDVEGVLAAAHHDDAAHGVPLAVEIGDAPSNLGAERHAPDVRDRQRRPLLVRLDDDLSDVLDRLEVAAAPDHVFAPRELDEAPADLVVALADRLHDGLERQAVRRERVRVQRHLVLLLEAAHARDLRDAGHRLHRVPQEPVLIRADLVGRVLPALVDERVLVDPADARRVGPELGLHPCGEARLDLRQVLEDARARPVDVGAVLEDDVDVREAEVREAPDRLHLRRAEKGRHDRIRDLVLEDVRAPVPARIDDDLRVREIGDGVERRPAG